MDFKINAYPVDDTVGGLRSSEKIKIVICYILKNVDAPMTRRDIRSALFDNSIANYFEINQAIEDLLSVGALKGFPSGEDANAGEILKLTENGERIARELESELSPYVKNKAVKAARFTLVLKRRQKENTVDIVKINDKKYRLDIKMSSGLEDSDFDELLSVSVYLTDYSQAKIMEENFFNNPSPLYESVIESLTGDPTFKE